MPIYNINYSNKANIAYLVCPEVTRNELSDDDYNRVDLLILESCLFRRLFHCTC